MAGKRQTRTGKWEYVFKRAGVLEKPLYLTFDTEVEGDEYARKLDALLDRGIVPPEHRAAPAVENIEQLVRAYSAEAHPSRVDEGALGTVVKVRGQAPLRAITAKWVDDWIEEMKRVEQLAPGTIRKKVGAMARCTDWGMRKGYLTMPDHPFRTLPDGYSQYSKTDEALAGEKREDVERDRRLEKGEFERVLAQVELGVLPRKQKPRPLEFKAAVRCMFVLAVETAMRMREQYTLSLDQVDLKRRTIFLDKTKNGDKRQVPLSSVAVAELEAYLKVREKAEGQPEGLLYPWWSGSDSDKDLADLSDYLSKLFKGVFEAAQCEGLRFHDLRHEATSRLFERTTLSEAQIMKITGHKSHRMMMRYANLRGSDLAERLW